MKDLVGLAADKKMEAALRQLLCREQALGIRNVEADIFRHPRHDPGVLLEAGKFLSVLVGQYRYALAMFDREGCGQEIRTATELQEQVQQQLDDAGWRDRSCVLVLDPELENWVWSDSPHVAEVLGVDKATLRKMVGDSTAPGGVKPSHPKELMATVLRQSKVAWSAALYVELAQKVSFERCSDPAFLRLKHCLAKWFSS